MTSLAGRTIFITGASRGIGLSIAKRCAQDGANIVIAAKTTEPHPTLPGTIYTAAKEVEEAGGQCLPCVVDIRSEEQVEKAMNEAVDKFGGIDILINNASAIHLTGTEMTPMKRYDLMHSVNIRGTFLCSKIAIPHLKKGTNPHILNLSPPLNMNPNWFKNHVAYTMAKYGMSMCALGMAEELRPDGIAVNTLWPRTAIYTAAMEMLGGGDIKSQCRTPDIMADSAYAILTKDSKAYTGNFCIDDEVLAAGGMTNFDKYAYEPGAKFMPDFFLDVPQSVDALYNEVKGAKGDSGASASGSGVEPIFQHIQSIINPDLLKSINGVFAFDLKDAGSWYLDLKNGPGSAGQGSPPQDPQCTMTLSPEDFEKMFSGKLNATQAFMAGQLKIKGDLALAMKLEKLMKQMKSQASGASTGASAGAAQGSGVEPIFQHIQSMINPDLLKSINGVFAFDLKDAGTWYLDLKNSPGASGRGSPPQDAQCTMTLSPEDFGKMFSGKLNATQAFMAGQLKIKGDLALAMKLEKLIKQMKSKL